MSTPAERRALALKMLEGMTPEERKGRPPTVRYDRSLAEIRYWNRIRGVRETDEEILARLKAKYEPEADHG